MKTIKKIILAILAMAIVTPAFADNQLIDSLIGAVAGGGAGRALCRNCKTSTRNIATGVAALGGAWVGSTVGDDSGKRFQQRQDQRAQIAQAQIDSQYNNNNGGYSSRTINTVDVSQPVQRQTTWINDAPPVYVERQAAPRRIIREVSAPADACSGEEYYRGEFNPEAAQAFCHGRMKAEASAARARQAALVEQAYRDGLSGEQ